MKELTRNQKNLVAAGVGVVGAGSSFFLGYKVAQKRLRGHYEAIAEKEIAVAKRFYADLNSTDVPDPEEMLETLHPGTARVNPVEEDLKERQRKEYQDRLKDLKYHPSNIEAPKATEEELIEKAEDIVEEKAEEAKTEIRNAFEDQDPEPAEDPDPPVGPEWDYTEEIANRTEGFPYIIHYDEFYANDEDYEQISLTWFDGDGVLVDARDQMVDDIDKKVGINNLHMFGHGSKDPRIVYIRNEALEVDFEIAKHDGNFGQAVHGFIEHSDDEMLRVPRRRRRLED